MKKLALVSLIALFFVFAYAFTPTTSVVVNPEMSSTGILEDTIKTTKTTTKKTSNKNYNKECGTKCGKNMSPSKCGSMKNTKKGTTTNNN